MGPHPVRATGLEGVCCGHCSTDILRDSTCNSISLDIVGGKFLAPCETFSPIREKQPAPRVLRTLEYAQGLPRDQLTVGEQKQLKEANIFVSRTASAAGSNRSGKPVSHREPGPPGAQTLLVAHPQILDVMDRKAEET